MARSGCTVGIIAADKRAPLEYPGKCNRLTSDSYFLRRLFTGKFVRDLSPLSLSHKIAPEFPFGEIAR